MSVEVVLHGPRRAEDDLGLVVEAAHVGPQRLAHDVVGGEEVAEPRQVGVVGSDQGQAQGARDQHGDHAERAGGRGVDHVDGVVLAPAQELEHRRHEERELLVDIEAEAVEGAKDLVPGLADALGAARDHGERPVLRDGEGDERLQHRGHAVDLLDRVGEHGDVRLGRRRPRVEQPAVGQLAVDVAGVGALAGQRGRRQQVGSDQRLRLTERLPGLERLLAEAFAAQVLEAVAHRALPGGLGDGGEALVAQPAADQGAAADDLGGAARRRPAQRAARVATADRWRGPRSVRRAAGCAGPRAPSRGCSSACRGAPACG